MKHDVASDSGVNVATTVRPLEIRGRFLTAVAVRLAGAPDDQFYESLDVRLQQTPHFFSDAPLIIDLDQAADLVDPADLQWLVDNLRQRDLSVFGVQNATADQAEAARAVGLISLSGGRDAPLRGSRREEERKPDPALEPEAAAPQAAPPPRTTTNKLVSTPVRSGQTVIADRGDLVIVGPVSSGAELIATGNIHIYGHMRGRAMAGINGDETARIFCQSLDAELLAIAGLYRTSENLGAELRRKSVQVYLEGERLRVDPLDRTQNRSGQ